MREPETPAAFRVLFCIVYENCIESTGKLC
jgi:hypothetical protein